MWWETLSEVYLWKPKKYREKEFLKSWSAFLSQINFCSVWVKNPLVCSAWLQYFHWELISVCISSKAAERSSFDRMSRHSGLSIAVILRSSCGYSCLFWFSCRLSDPLFLLSVSHGECWSLRLTFSVRWWRDALRMYWTVPSANSHCSSETSSSSAKPTQSSGPCWGRSWARWGFNTSTHARTHTHVHVIRTFCGLLTGSSLMRTTGYDGCESLFYLLQIHFSMKIQNKYTHAQRACPYQDWFFLTFFLSWDFIVVSVETI